MILRIYKQTISMNLNAETAKKTPSSPRNYFKFQKLSDLCGYFAFFALKKAKVDDQG